MIEIQDSAHYIHILKVFEVSLLKLFNHSLILIMYGIYLKNKTISICQCHWQPTSKDQHSYFDDSSKFQSRNFRLKLKFISVLQLKETICNLTFLS